MKRFSLLLVLFALLGLTAAATVGAEVAPATPDLHVAEVVDTDATTALELGADFETVETGLPESAVVEMARIPIRNQCPAYCTRTNLTYVGVTDCYHGDCFHACKLYRDNQTGVICAGENQCYAY
ncbi:MAG: hypothetical protein AAGC60_15100 [Acidobacteriota bacterium]